VCRIALFADGAPYIIPLNFGFEWENELRIYFHCANQGRKLDLIQANPRAGFELDVGHELVTGEKACDWGMKFASLVGDGTIRVVSDPAERKRGLDLLMVHYSFPGVPSYSDEMLRAVTVLCLEVREVTGKRKG
jgi:nitroimidazol reductase NimA-like FMN-containing flavoprotein (pyridoxamine 5'-phosphate oxidase superfamily)